MVGVLVLWILNPLSIPVSGFWSCSGHSGGGDAGLARGAFGFEDEDVMEVFHPVESMMSGLALNDRDRKHQKRGKCGRIAAVD